MPASMASIVAMLITPAHQLELFEEDEQIDCDADAAQREPGEIERDVEQKQRKLEGIAQSSTRAAAPRMAKQTSDATMAEHYVEGDDGGGLARGAASRVPARCGRRAD